MTLLDPFLADVIACPLCRRPLTVEEALLTCASCRRTYPIVDGIPVLLVSEARVIDEPEAEHAEQGGSA